MQEKLRNIFMNSKLLMTSAVIAEIFWVFWGVWCLTGKDGFLYELTADAVFYFFIILGLLLAYKKGETNVQKALLGALFFLLCNSSIEILWTYLKLGLKGLSVLFVIITVLTVVNMVGHIMQQSDHVGKRGAVMMNQCNTLLAALIFAYCFHQAFLAGSFVVIDVSFLTAWLFTVILVVCIETRINEYKNIRYTAKKSGTWDNDAREEAKKIFKI